MKYSTMDQVSALSGVFQATNLVHTLANTGQLNKDAFSTSINSIFVTSPRSIGDVYGGYNNLDIGLKTLYGVLSKDRRVIQSNVVRYALALIHIEKKLTRHKSMLKTISNRLDRTKEQIKHFGVLHANVMSNLASIYIDTISTFKTRIKVSGEFTHLQNTANADKIRAILLAGIRSAILWRQCGGSRWHLIFSRERLLKDLRLISPNLSHQ